MTKRDFKRHVRQVDLENGEMAGLKRWKAAREIAAMTPVTYEDRIRKAAALAALTDQEYYIGEITHTACALLGHSGMERIVRGRESEQMAFGF